MGVPRHGGERQRMPPPSHLGLHVDAEAKRSLVLACGGFEDAMVATYARETLEGGDEAFMARHKRYLTHLES